MVGKELFPNLLTWDAPNLLEIKQKQNNLRIFIDKPFELQKIHEKCSYNIFIFGGCPIRGG